METTSSWTDHVVVTLRRYAIHRGCRPCEADDVVQETLCRAFEKLATDGGEPSDKWLRVVASRVMIDRHRKTERDAKLAARLHVAPVPDHSDQIEDQLLAIFAISVLSSLPLTQREVLTDISRGLSVADIARDRRLTIRSVEGHLRRARAQVRKHLLGSSRTCSSRDTARVPEAARKRRGTDGAD